MVRPWLWRRWPHKIQHARGHTAEIRTDFRKVGRPLELTKGGRSLVLAEFARDVLQEIRDDHKSLGHASVCGHVKRTQRRGLDCLKDGRVGTGCGCHEPVEFAVQLLSEGLPSLS